MEPSYWIVLAVVALLIYLGFRFISKLLSLLPLGIAIFLIILWLISRGGWQTIINSYHHVDPNGKASSAITKICRLTDRSGS